jgi:hypothetical protein
MNIGGPLTQGLLEDLIDSFGDVFRPCIRLRVDGVLHALPLLAPELAAPVIARLKVMASLDIAASSGASSGRACSTPSTRRRIRKCVSVGSI